MRRRILSPALSPASVPQILSAAQQMQPTKPLQQMLEKSSPAL